MTKQDFDNRIDAGKHQEQELQKVYNKIVHLRVIIGLLLIYFLYKSINTQLTIYVVMAGAGVLAFLALVIWHGLIKRDIAVVKLYQKINDEYISRLYDNWQAFEDGGIDLAAPTHPYAFDLDIIGEASLYKKISVANTFLGREKLADYLLNREQSVSVREYRQKAINELSNNIDFVQQLQVILRQNKTVRENPNKWINIASQKIPLPNVIDILAPAFPIIVIGLFIIGKVTNSSLVIIVAFAFALVAAGLRLFIPVDLSILRTVRYQLEPYIEVFSLLDKTDFKSEYLLNKKKQLDGILEGLSKLEHIATLATFSQQPLFAIPLNGIFMWDFWIAKMCIQWQRNFGFNIQEALNLVAEIEALASLTTLSFLEELHYALIDKPKQIIAKDIGHPLICKEKRVTNDFSLKNEIFIITGSNMSGKTTFLRTIGINLVMAYAGAPVCAKSLQCCALDIYTSMRIGDNLGQNTSTFHAEITRMQLILEAKDKGILFLMDEIFRGTNSNDRISGAKSVIYALKRAGAIGAITTHDLEMCVLGDEEGISNYHFTDLFENEKMYFDYKLKTGIATKTNAKYLMEMIGLEID
ncbi:MAG: hypothetical protein BEN18_04560 [Epulopiscium sp. Nuni2H_MBin001]|nr:MAG: hypothetical protein BEN18_04560 [Epulopiscium sp. Nuni2H_MBin001]